MTPWQRFDAMMTYQAADAVPNWELGAWPQAMARWEAEGLPPGHWRGDWFSGIATLGMDPRIFAPLHFGMVPGFDHAVLAEDERTVTVRNAKGIVSRALKEGSVGGGRLSMDQYLSWPVESMADFERLAERYDPADPRRYPDDWDALVAQWRERDCPLVLGRNCLGGFYWNLREWMGTEHLSVAFFDQPKLVEAMAEFVADFLIAVTARARADITFDYFVFNEDIAYKTAPLLSPAQYQRFILPHLKRVIDEFKRHGVRWIGLDTDGNCNPLIPLWMDAGVDILWPLEQAADDMDPVTLRRRYGRGLRLWGGVDKRAVAQGGPALEAELGRLRPLVDEGGFVPHLDHTFPPDIGLDAARGYFAAKERLLAAPAGAPV